MFPQNEIGHFRELSDVSTEYALWARADEAAANALAEAGLYRHAVYFVVQAIEKHLRAKIFSVASPLNEAVRQANRNHSVEEAAAFLVATFDYDGRLCRLIQEQFDKCLLRGVRFNLLHNDLRYPAYLDRVGGFASLDVSERDLLQMFERLDWLKEFMKEVDLLV